MCVCILHGFFNIAVNRIKDYNEIWTDLRKCSYVWRQILVPGHCVFDLGVSEAIYSSISRAVIAEKPSPVIFMRARKNPTELSGMRKAHILDGAAMCDALSLLERRVCNMPLLLPFWSTCNQYLKHVLPIVILVFESRNHDRNECSIWYWSSSIFN